MIIPILKMLKQSAQISRFVPYMLDKNLQVEKKFPGTEKLDMSGYKMDDFAIDNKLVMEWFSTLQNDFNGWQRKHSNKKDFSDVLFATGSRSFNASYTESDLECAIVSENFEDFVDFCRFLNLKYNEGHTFISLKTLAGLPLLIIKGKEGFSCTELSKIYSGKRLPQLEVTFRHPEVHKIIQKAGMDFFKELNSEELESYVFNKRYIELMLRNTPQDATFEEKPLKAALEEFKGSLAAALKCLPPGKLQETPEFNKEVFANITKPQTIVSDSINSGLNFYKKQESDSFDTQFQPQNNAKF